MAQKFSSDVLIVTDGHQTNSAAIIVGYAFWIIIDYNREISPNNRAKINIITRNRYNPNLEYFWFMLAGVVAMLAVVVTLLLTALSVA